MKAILSKAGVEMTPEVEAGIKQQTWERMRKRNGDDWVEEHARFIEHQWEWVKELRMVDEETDLKTRTVTGP